jgi:37-kD nucleoid-associated bacterial protein
MIKWDEFEVVTAAVHYIPTERDEDDPEPLLTDEVIDLDAGLKLYFRDKIADRLKAKGLEVVVDDEREQVVPEAVAEIVADPAKLLDLSKQIALHLDEKQHAGTSSGLLAVVHGLASGVPCVAIIKLERERGVRFAIDTVDGKHIVDLELLRNLTLTDKTKVFKTAVLLCAGGQDATAVEGYVADDQRSTAQGRQVATFFLSAFLGCKPKVPAAQITYDFVKAANESFNEDVESPERKGRYQVALLSAMQSNVADIKPKSFASTHLDREDRPAFLERVRRAGIDPEVTFAKDTSRVKVSGFRMIFDSGMVLVGDMESLDQRVKLPEKQDGQEPVELNDTVQRLLTGR